MSDCGMKVATITNVVCSNGKIVSFDIHGDSGQCPPSDLEFKISPSEPFVTIESTDWVGSSFVVHCQAAGGGIDEGFVSVTLICPSKPECRHINKRILVRCPAKCGPLKTAAKVGPCREDGTRSVSITVSEIQGSPQTHDFELQDANGATLATSSGSGNLTVSYTGVLPHGIHFLQGKGDWLRTAIHHRLCR